MAKWGGYTGKILRVDLSTETITDDTLDEATARKYLGGTGLGAKILYDEVPPEVQWSDPANRIIIAGGPLSGTPIGGAGTISVVTRGPMTNGTAATQANGFFGAFLKFSGYDAMVIQGRASRWLYLYIHDGTAELRDAAHLAGKDTWETCDLIKGELGKTERGMSVAAIGPAGEHLVRWACPVVDKDHVPSHNGTGAVMGSKRLKAIAVNRGKTRPPLSDKEGVAAIARLFHDEQLTYMFGEFGTLGLFAGGTMGLSGMLIMNNLTQVYSEEHQEELDHFGAPYVREHYQAQRDSCWACNAHHCHKLTIPDGPYQGEAANEPEYEVALAFGPVIGNYEVSAAVHLSNLGDRLGFDANEAGWTLGLAIECYEKGLISKKETDGLELTWGNYKAVDELMHRIAHRQGFGDVLAEGAMRAAQHIGGEALEMAVHTMAGVTPRGIQWKQMWPGILDTCLGQTGTNEGFEFMLSPEDMGIECSLPYGTRMLPSFSIDDTVEFNVKTGWSGHFNDSLGVCYFSTGVGDFKRLVDAVRAATGWEFTPAEAAQTGLRIQNLLRAFNVRCGRTRKMDAPSPRMTSPVEGPMGHEDIKPHWDEILDRYYEGMGWDIKTGKPLPETLKKLGLEQAIPALWGK